MRAKHTLSALALATASAAAPAGAPTTHTNTPTTASEVRARLRGLNFIREQILTRSVGRRYALGGRLALIRVDTPQDLDELITLAASYRQIVTELLAFPVKDYLLDPGTRAAVLRAWRWGIDHAIAEPHYHKAGYARVVRILTE